MNWGSSADRRLLIAYLGLVIFVLSIQLTLHFTPRVIAEYVRGGGLEGEWRACWSETEATPCEWKAVSLPGSVSLQKATPASVLTMERDFALPQLCTNPEQPCSLFIGTVSDPAEFFLNGTSIGKVGRPGQVKSYTQTFPISIPIAPGILAPDNTLRVRMVPNYLGNQGLIRGPLHLFHTDTSLWVARIVIAQTVGLPLISGVILLLLFFATILVAENSKIWDLRLRSFAGYCLTMGLYLISLTRLPREVLPPQLGIAIHFGLRVLTEYFHFGFVVALFARDLRWVRVARFLAVFLCVSLIAPAALDLVGVPMTSLASLGRLLYRGSVALFLAPPLLYLYFVLRTPREERSVFLPLAVLYGLVCLRIVSDFLAINGFVEDIYFVRFYPVLLALGQCSTLWLTYSKIRERNRINLELGQLSAQVAHDIRSPLAALNVVAGSLENLNPSQKGLLQSAIARIGGIADGLLRQKPGAPVAFRPKPIVEQVSAAVEAKRLELKNRPGVQIQFEPPADLSVQVEMEPLLFQRVLSNLLNNAIEALAVTGLLHVSIELGPKEIAVKIRDNGKGIPADILSQLGQEGATFGKKSGNGIGLFHARKTIESWGGRLELSSQLGAGTTVTIRLPRVS